MDEFPVLYSKPEMKCNRFVFKRYYRCQITFFHIKFSFEKSSLKFQPHQDAQLELEASFHYLLIQTDDDALHCSHYTKQNNPIKRG